ncbi:hypothetical protein M8C21_029716, partial [Ambrosia artemisiifolia]
TSYLCTELYNSTATRPECNPITYVYTPPPCITHTAIRVIYYSSPLIVALVAVCVKDSIKGFQIFSKNKKYDITYHIFYRLWHRDAVNKVDGYLASYEQLLISRPNYHNQAWCIDGLQRHTVDLEPLGFPAGQASEANSSSIAIRYLEWNSGVVVYSNDTSKDTMCSLQDIGGHIMKIPIISFHILLCMRLEVCGFTKLKSQPLRKYFFSLITNVSSSMVVYEISQFYHRTYKVALMELLLLISAGMRYHFKYNNRHLRFETNRKKGLIRESNNHNR